ncbi:complement C1q tumor necrosis factor-related protein 5-like [Heptranchias perlo]|uniref:complement C1q tumor necrosis factor-related protein 5-like n=1 Tax=Heptranchias perlo TaxID=212740 RepID=UPI0035594DCD
MISWGKKFLLVFITIQCLAEVTAAVKHRAKVEGLMAQRLWDALQQLEEKVEALEHHGEEVVHDHHAVLFSVALSDSDQAIVAVGPIVYDQVLLNEEGGYNSTTGVFTCPIPGVYYLAYTSLPQRGLETSVSLVRNGARLDTIYSGPAGDSTQLSARSELIRLQKADRLWVELEAGALLSDRSSLKFQAFRISD